MSNDPMFRLIRSFSKGNFDVTPQEIFTPPEEMTPEQKLEDLHSRIQVMRQELLIMESGTPECEAKRKILAASEQFETEEELEDYFAWLEEEARAKQQRADEVERNYQQHLDEIAD